MEWFKDYSKQVKECIERGNRFIIEYLFYTDGREVCVPFKTYCHSLACLEKREKEGIVIGSRKEVPPLPSPPPMREYKSTLFCGLVETKESKQKTFNWNKKRGRTSTKEILHILRNPHDYTKAEVKVAGLKAADLIEELEKDYQKQRDWAEENGLDVTTYTR